MKDKKETQKIDLILKELGAKDFRIDGDLLSFCSLESEIIGSKVGEYYRQRKDKSRIYIPSSVMQVYYEAGVNPNGISGPNDVGITYSIGVKLPYRTRGYRRKNEYNSDYGFYFYTRTIEEFKVKLKQKLKELEDSFIGDINFYKD